jgi:Xaa-Pro aminopeptidase
MLRDYERTVAQLMGKSLVKLGLATNASDMHAIRTYFPHASSHFLGLDVHDAGDYTIPLEENMVLTCEPGIYIPEENIGVRIEDDIVITAQGNSNLSQNCSYDAYVLY